MSFILGNKSSTKYTRRLIFMDNEAKNADNVNSVTETKIKAKIGIPLIALGLDLLPFIWIFISYIGVYILISPLVIILSPIAGLILGISALSRGKKYNGLLGNILAIITIAIPVSLVVLIIVLYIGAATGIISLM